MIVAQRWDVPSVTVAARALVPLHAVLVRLHRELRGVRDLEDTVAALWVLAEASRPELYTPADTPPGAPGQVACATVPLMTTGEVATFLELHPRSVRDLEARGTLQKAGTGKRGALLFDPEVVESYKEHRDRDAQGRRQAT